MDSVNKTLYIPLYGKAFVSRMGILLHDPKAEAIWDSEGFPLKGKAKSKWLAYNMGMRSAVFDRWTKELAAAHPDAAILHLGCGMDSRCQRLNLENPWFDVDFPDVIAERKRFFAESPSYRMLSSDIREEAWLEAVPGDSAIVVMEGVSMYLTEVERRSLLAQLSRRFSRVHILMDSYTVFAAKATKYKNPINEVGVTEVHGFDDPAAMADGTGIRFVTEHELCPGDLIARLPRKEQDFFRTMFAGRFAKRIYRLYEYEKDTV